MGPATVLALQGSAGNRAVASRRAGQIPFVQRDATVDHVDREDIGRPVSARGHGSSSMTETIWEGGGTHVAEDHSGFSWGLIEDLFYVAIDIQFVGAPSDLAIPILFDGIRRAWNRFHFRNTKTGARILIRFLPKAVHSGADHVVTLLRGYGRSNSRQWHVGNGTDTRTMGDTAAHEFGHLLGLTDEYRQTPADLRRAGVSDAELEPGGNFQELVRFYVASEYRKAHPISVEQCALKLRAALHDPIRNHRGVRARELLENHVHPGRFTEALERAYVELFRISPIDDAREQIPGDPNENLIIGYMRPSSWSLMGNQRGVGARPRDIPSGEVLPRHLQQFVRLVGSVRGGTWIVDRD